jgi:hypothetical protein
VRGSFVTPAVNPVELKIALATRGARIDARLRALVDAVPDFTPRGLQLVLPDGVQVLVPIDDATSASAPYRVVAEAERAFVVDDRALRVEVRAGALPVFYGRKTRSGRPMWQIATVQGMHLLVHPTALCGFSTLGAPCSFCREGARPMGERERAASIADVVDVVRAAFEEGVAEFVFFNSSVYDADDGGIGFLTPYIESVRKHFDTFVAVQVHPPRTDAWIDRSYAMGVDALSYNLELFDPEALGRHCIGRVRYIGRERYLDALAYAAGVFPAGTVWTDLVLGLEPAEATMAGIDAIARLGVVPVLAVHHPGPDAIAQVSPDEAAAVVGHLDRTVREQNLNVTWVRDLALGVTPLDACRFTGTTPPGNAAVQALTRWRIGAYAARGLARFRRRLRVNAISDSLESSHL